MAFFAFLAGVSDPARKLTGMYTDIARGMVASDRLFPMLDRIPAVRDPETPRAMPQQHAELIFDGVTFEYLPNQPVLHNLSLKIPFGQCVALVGPNGCGKSTLANLILRFYDPTSGAVRLDYTDLKEVRQRDLRAIIGMVTQQPHLFDDSVLENIRYGAPHASKADVIEAAKKAHAHRFIDEALEDGYHTNVGERGGRVSGGQRQRIALARAIVRDPQILILDEATSQVDPESELLIHKALEQFIRGRTTIMITHRLSTLALADRILVMDDGHIVGDGRHTELLEKCDLYRRLHQTDFRETA
jgi:ATP-binding cassette subfamily B protein/subfamily B ATP-binding cassette protein MsbA